VEEDDDEAIGARSEGREDGGNVPRDKRGLGGGRKEAPFGAASSRRIISLNEILRDV